MAITRLKIITCIQFQCTPVQLEILRRAGAMPISSRWRNLWCPYVCLYLYCYIGDVEWSLEEKRSAFVKVSLGITHHPACQTALPLRSCTSEWQQKRQRQRQKQRQKQPTVNSRWKVQIQMCLGLPRPVYASSLQFLSCKVHQVLFLQVWSSELQIQLRIV